MADCPFCQRIKAGDYDVENARWDAVSFEPLNPVTPGHRLVVPRVHVQDALASPIITGNVMALAADIAEHFGLAPCNIITSAGALASQTVFHLHVHMVPRRLNDGLALPWSQDPKCSYCYCRLADAPECADGCGHRDISGHIGCGLKIPPSTGPGPKRAERKSVKGVLPR